MSPILTARISEGMKSEIEELVEQTGLWPSRTEFVKEALDKQIKKYWTGDRYANYSRHASDEEG
jgi:Arc/MetJ-type ribon-helix-helix transcriptional regulator